MRLIERLPAPVVRRLFNFFPCYRGTGGRVVAMDEEWRKVRVVLPLSWRTRNYVGSIFGGSMSGAVDPLYMLMLIKNLGPDYVVWDKAARIRFRRPARRTLTADFTLTEEDIESIRQELTTRESCERTYEIELKDPDGVVCAHVEKVIHLSRRKAP